MGASYGSQQGQQQGMTAPRYGRSGNRTWTGRDRGNFSFGSVTPGPGGGWSPTGPQNPTTPTTPPVLPPAPGNAPTAGAPTSASLRAGGAPTTSWTGQGGSQNLPDNSPVNYFTDPQGWSNPNAMLGQVYGGGFDPSKYDITIDAQGNKILKPKGSAS